jgi:hypothetical protein
MMAPGFKPVGWVAAVAVSAIGCYMLSLNVAAERAELAKVERQIIATKQQIRALQTELGTRGRMAQLEQWNSEVLALSAPTSAQFLNNEMTLARFDQRPATVEERATLRMASAQTGEPDTVATDELPEMTAAAAPAPSPAPALGRSQLAQSQMVRRASMDVGPAVGLRSASLSLPVARPAGRPADGAAPPKPAPPPKAATISKLANVTKAAPPAKTAAATRTVPVAKPALQRATDDRTSPKPALRSASLDIKAIRHAEDPKPKSRLSGLAREIGAAAKAEARSGGR